MTIADFYRAPLTREIRPIGMESDWLSVADLPVASGMVLLVDVSFVPHEEDGLVINLAPRSYGVAARVLDFGVDRRVSRLKVVADGNEEAAPGARLGRAWTDTGRIGVCDLGVFKASWGDDITSYAVIASAIEGADPYGVAVLDEGAGARMCFVESGFGDGEFPVRELLSKPNRERIGFEVTFIRPKTRYPFPG